MENWQSLCRFLRFEITVINYPTISAEEARYIGGFDGEVQLDSFSSKFSLLLRIMEFRR